MSKVKHTPGPWEVDDEFCIVPGPAGGSIAEVWGDTEEQQEANARLIAAAPDMLAALEAVLPDLKHYVSTHGPGPDRRLEAALKAIAKAKGQERR